MIEFEWQFTPPDAFEEPTELSCLNYRVSVDKGRATLRVSLEGGQPAWEGLGNELHESLYAHFLAAQVLSHDPFTLSKPSYARIRSDGGRDIFVTVEGAILCARVGRLDAAVTVSGEVVRDDRRERINRRKMLGASAVSHLGDVVLNSILRSYMAAVNDPRNELIHLYEIRDALSDRFEGQAQATAALGVSGSAWSTLGRLADGEPLREGRHRGKFPGDLRDATEAELDKARGIARDLVIGYVSYLDSVLKTSGK